METIIKKKSNNKDYLTGIDTFSSQENLFLEKTGKTFEDVYAKYYDKLLFYISKFIADDELKVQDITTDTFLRAFSKVITYDKDKGEFSTWLFTIGRNLVMQDMQSKKQIVSMDTVIDDNGSTLKDFISENYNGDNNSEKIYELVDKKYDIMIEAINKLKPDYKKIITMREIERMSYQQITEELDLLLSTTKSRIRSARIKLIEIVEKDFKLLDEMYK